MPIPTSQIPSQQGTDLAYIKELADEVGYVFYLEPGPVPGVNIAYWGPQIKVGVPQPALNINMDAHTNVESLSFSFNNNLNTIPTVFHYDETTKAAIANADPADHAAQSAAGPDSSDPDPASAGERRLSKRPLPQAIMIGLAKASQWAEAVTGKGELDVCATGIFSRPASWSACAARGRPTTGCIT